jgi:hypothetical protein
VKSESSICNIQSHQTKVCLNPCDHQYNSTMKIAKLRSYQHNTSIAESVTGNTIIGTSAAIGKCIWILHYNIYDLRQQYSMWQRNQAQYSSDDSSSSSPLPEHGSLTVMDIISTLGARQFYLHSSLFTLSILCCLRRAYIFILLLLSITTCSCLAFLFYATTGTHLAYHPSLFALHIAH